MSESGERNTCLAFSLDSEDSILKKTDGSEIPFTRAVLTLRNACAGEISDVQLHAELGQEGGTAQDVSHALASPDAASIAPGGSTRWDVYDMLLPAHQGISSKVHMFGHRAILNWNFELSVRAEYRVAGSGAERTSPSRWNLRWNIPDPAAGAVQLAVEKKD